MKLKKLSIVVVLLTAISTSFTSCKKEGCTDATAENYSSDAKKDDGSCTYAAAVVTATKTEMIIDGVWNATSVTTTGDSTLLSNMTNFFENATFDFNVDGTANFIFPNEPTASEMKTWEFNSGETSITLDKGLEKEDVLTINTLTASSLVFTFDEESTGALITVSLVH